MKRIILIASIMLPSAALAQSPGTVDSFYVTFSNQSGIPVNVTGPLSSDFIVTDVFGAQTQAIVTLQENDGKSAIDKARMIVATGFCPYSILSGLRFAAGSSIHIITDSEAAIFVTISGYYDAPAGNVPAVSTWGLVALTLLIVSVGSVLIRRRGVV